MTITLQPHSSMKGSPFVDRSNRHAHLRPSAAPSKSPPTCTLSLASASSSSACAESPFPASGVPFPHDADLDTACGDDVGPSPEPWRRPRARTSHVQTPLRTRSPRPVSTSTSASDAKTKSKPRRVPVSKRPSTNAAADLRFAALLERSISQRMCERVLPGDDIDSESVGGPESEPLGKSASDALDAQDALLAARLRALLARRRPSSPLGTGIAPPPRPASVLLSGSTFSRSTSTDLSDFTLALSGSESTLLPSGHASPLPLPPPRFLPRSRSGSRSSTSVTGRDTLPMHALVASLLLKRRNEKERVGASVRARTLGRPCIKSPLAQVAGVRDLD
ncbi:hypothetical protein C8R44DRAFT_193413 [Mycena epipterygia]|nr:hypothetical protein C8R44DRAFT_193413 [Mycena epipterygia]